MKLTDTLENEYSSLSQEKQVMYKQAGEIDKIIPLYENWLSYMNSEGKQKGFYHVGYSSALERIATLAAFSQEDISQMGIHLIAYQDSKYFRESGYFLSALINTHQERTRSTETYILSINHLQKRISNICYKHNGGIVLVNGNVDDNTCSEMKRGIVHIKGSTNLYCGQEMRGGLVFIEGFVTDFLASKMKDGGIIVSGDVGYIGNSGSCSFMTGGFIHIKGNARNISFGQMGGSVLVCGDAESPSLCMEGGSLTILGTAYDACSLMKGGRVYCQGEIKSKRSNEKIKEDKSIRPYAGKIYHKNKRIFPKENETMSERIARWKRNLFRNREHIIKKK